MASGNPPRHSKSTDEPVTIDLDAQEIASANDAEKDQQAPLAATESEIPGAGTEPLPREPDAPSEKPFNGADAADEPPVGQHQAHGNTSGLIAAGIVGGLIALVGAGAIQYAGFLPGPSATPSQSTEVSNLAGEIDGLKQSVANLAASPPATPDTKLEGRIAALEAAEKTAAPAGGDGASVDALNQKIADLTSQITQLQTAVASVGAERNADGADIEKRLAQAEKKLNEPRQDVAVAQAIAAAALKAAIDRGGPFAAELDTFAGVSPDDPVVASLRSYAETGVPSRAELIRQVPDVATAIIDSANQADPNESWSDRLMSSAKSLVKVRPVGNIEGDSVDAIAARLENKVKNGDLPGASAEWNDLPAAAKQTSAAFKQSLEARIRVEELVGNALSKAVSGTGREG
ncbi:hypothetical protein ASE04_00815 [Rhizobium sp. Root708]|uniref:COG4223 family protein n=1 Tax=Rhizobium sp. Root708 TaxID=1736592 RepID=UPI0007014046|nr:mitofilin family membrane protein [Rhizobium sp. Root708]KRB62751.1 hypothetical protein ASE04_00815 [Rhizobium sp. Root708]